MLSNGTRNSDNKEKGRNLYMELCMLLDFTCVETANPSDKKTAVIPNIKTLTEGSISSSLTTNW